MCNETLISFPSSSENRLLSCCLRNMPTNSTLISRAATCTEHIYNRFVRLCRQSSRFIHSSREPPPTTPFLQVATSYHGLNPIDDSKSALQPFQKNQTSIASQLSPFISWYTCGPTVYDVAHLGHARTYVTVDILRRIVENVFYHPVFFALGITDIDDKIINKAKAEQIPASQIAQKYESEFFADMDALNVKQPHALLRVTDHMEDIISTIEKLVKEGYAYAAESGDVYFDLQKYRPYYGVLDPSRKLTDQDLANQENLADNEINSNRGKKTQQDFALWKSRAPDGPSQDIEPCWQSPWGLGRPGWHIECSAVIRALFGNTLDVHAGGIDLRFPHHENEIALCQSFLLHQDRNPDNSKVDPWCRLWIHTGHLHIKGRKMSKSLKNFISVREYLDGSFGGITNNPTMAADVFRTFCLQYRYSTNIELSQERIDDALSVFKRFMRFVENTKGLLTRFSEDSKYQSYKDGKKNVTLVTSLANTKNMVMQSLANDFDTPRAIDLISSMISFANTRFHHNPCPSEIKVLHSMADYVVHFLETMGYHATSSADLGFRSSQVSAYHTTASGRQTQVDFVDDLVSIRAKIRELASQKDSDPKQVRKLLYQLSDTIRDVIHEKTDVRIEDRKDGETKMSRF